MQILLTGASSFTGYWFVRELVAAGHRVVATFRQTSLDRYHGLRHERVRWVADHADCRWGLSFGEEGFLDLMAGSACDLFCHHGAEMAGYRSWDFDTLAACRATTRNLRAVAERLHQAGCRGIVMTGTVFEPYEGVGDHRRRAFSPYGLSKHISFELVRLEAERLGLTLGKFVIPNPFGPFEESRFTSYLAREWARGRVPVVKTPAYVRDNIHVSLLAGAYRVFCERTATGQAPDRMGPSGYVESQGAFAARVAAMLSPYFGRQLPMQLADQTTFDEPRVRVNAEPAVEIVPGWSEANAWQALAEFYQSRPFRD